MQLFRLKTLESVSGSSILSVFIPLAHASLQVKRTKGNDDVTTNARSRCRKSDRGRKRERESIKINITRSRHRSFSLASDTLIRTSRI